MSDQEPQGTAAGTAEELLDALRSAAGDAATRETIAELGARARAIVEGLSRVSRSGLGGAAASSSSSGAGETRSRPARDDAAFADAPQSGADVAGLQRGVEGLRAGVAQIGDLLEATLERLETVEMQLGDPAESVEQRVAAGLQGCERVLAGIEHRLHAANAAREAARAATSPRQPARGAAPGPAPVVLVVAPGSSRRAALCLALEKEGLRAVAALDLLSARVAVERHAPDVALLAPDDDDAEFLDDWAEACASALLPPAVVVGAGAAASRPGLVPAREQHGGAALAASLVALARGAQQQQQQQQ